MAKRKVTQTAEETVVVQEVTGAPSLPFWEQNQKFIMYVLGGIALVLGAWWLYKTMVKEPQNKEAIGAMWRAERMFEQDSFASALNGPAGGYDGFLALADKYSGTAAGNAAAYYAGICYLQTGDFDNAIKYLEDSDVDGEFMPALRLGALGDAYSEKKDFDKALSLYEKASNATENEVIASYFLKKLGLLYEYQNKPADAKEAYEKLRTEYPSQMSQDWREIEKFIYRTGGGK